MSFHVLLFATVAAVLSVIFNGLDEMFITNVLLGIIAGKLMEKK